MFFHFLFSVHVSILVTIHVFIPLSIEDCLHFNPQVDLLRGQKSDKVDVTIQPEELEVMDDVLAAK